MHSMCYPSSLPKDQTHSPALEAWSLSTGRPRESQHPDFCRISWFEMCPCTSSSSTIFFTRSIESCLCLYPALFMSSLSAGPTAGLSMLPWGLCCVTHTAVSHDCCAINFIGLSSHLIHSHLNLISRKLSLLHVKRHI